MECCLQDRLTFAFIDNEETFKNYPFHFNLAVSYRLAGNELHVIWHVENTDDKVIYFQIGGHPAFKVPGCEKGEKLKATLKLDNEAPTRLFATIGGCVDPNARETVQTDNGILEVTDESFADDAYIFDKSQVKQISLLNEKGEPHVTVEFKTPAVGVWNPGNHAPFICLQTIDLICLFLYLFQIFLCFLFGFIQILLTSIFQLFCFLFLIEYA